MLTAQTTIDRLIDCEVGNFGIYLEHPLPLIEILADIRALGAAFVYAAKREDIESVVPVDLAAELRSSLQTGELGSPSLHCRTVNFKESPLSVVGTAVAVTAALSVLNCLTVNGAAAALVALHSHADRAKLEQGIRVRHKVSGSASPVLRAICIASRGARLNTAEQLRCRVGSALPRRPIDNSARDSRITAGTPTLFWPTWALRLCPPNYRERTTRPALAPALALVGTTMTSGEAAIALGNTVTTSHNVMLLLGKLSRTPQWPGIRSALIRLSDYLETVGAPIDYHRRRQLNYSELLPDAQWTDIACAASIRPVGAAIARCFLYERLSGSAALPAHVSRQDLRTYFRMLNFPLRLTPELLVGLDHCALNFLAEQGITDEPVCWEPPKELVAGAALPGVDIDTVDTMELHRVVRGSHTLAEAATKIGISVSAARCILEHHPAPQSARPPRKRPRRESPAYRKASTVYPHDRLVDLYREQHLSIETLAAMAGVSNTTIAKLLRNHDIPPWVAGPSVPLQVDRDWVYTEHVTRGRSLNDLARELDASTAELSLWAKRQCIPVRRGPRHSLDELRTNDKIPELLIPALVGIGGWERLMRFVSVLEYPSFSKAAQSLHVSTGSVIVAVLRLERDLGGRLVDRWQNSRPMRPTALGHRVQLAATRLHAAGGPWSA
ncbi:hypothetical protein A5630_20755 [Mycolicibacterium mucogenicum]|uniref:HTH lysR-type domain-containing protein n=1 Tax=Mycolicibacterium mucogenicum TaxID=56689 RepID=A0A1A3H2M4_MYCMU|nr:LysR family transcriptional regulator [Mycolicibacterium mucogenicum]OBJ42542.1 hypothetical protein A5630_20755 [Mycolicibacterium mucogenicum]